MLLVGITLTATFFEGFGVAMLFPVIDFIEKGKDVTVLAESSRMWLHIVRALDFFSLPKTLIALMSVVFGLLLIRQLFNYLKNIYSRWLSERVSADIRTLGFHWFSRADMTFHDNHGVGELVNVLTIDGVRASGGIFTFFNLLAASVILLLYFLFLLLLSPGMTFFAMGVMGCVGVVLRSRIRKSSRIGTEVSKYNEIISASIVERLNGVRLLKLSASEDSEAAFVKGLSEKIRTNTYKLGRIKAKIEFLVDPMVILSGLVILYFSVEVFQLSLATTGIFIFVLIRLLPYTKEFFNLRQGLAGFSGSLFRVTDLFKEAQGAEGIKGGNVTDLKLKRGIRFEDVSFRYSMHDELVLKKLNVFIPAGKMTALVGRSGVGKSTLVDMIPRLRVPTEGRISMDDVSIEAFDLRTLRRSIALVSQEGFLFNDSIANNIRYCLPKASLEETRVAARMAFADDFIQALPQGYETVIGERGVKLSGGQRQRVILARALLQEAEIIILDEPTSSLDSESEQYIQKAIEGLRADGNVTMIVIAHRLSTIKSADQIIVLERGGVVECGRHGDLVHDDAWYAEIVKIQAAS